MARSLSVKLTLVVLSVSLLSVALVALLARWVTTREFDRFVLGQLRAGFVTAVVDYYQEHGSWQGVVEAPALRQALQDQPPPPPGALNRGALPPPRRANPFALLDQNGCIVVPAGAYAVGDCPLPDSREEREPVRLNGNVIGTVITLDTAPGRNPIEAAYIRRTTWAVLFSALGAAGLALLLGSWVARTLTRPLRTLTTAIHAMATGELQQEVEVQSQDELGELAAAFNRMSAELAQANLARQQMTADIAHELRNPLMVMIGYLEAMRDEVLQPTPERLNTMYDEALHLQRLVADLRTLSLADAGELSLQREQVTPQELLTRVADAYHAQAQPKQITLVVNTATNLPAVAVDPERIGQVLNNLVSNALRYTPAQGQITLGATAQNGAVALTVADNGAGIPTAALPHVFDRFYRADPARQQSSGESGLGLAIARSIVTAHGGAIAVTSTPGAGSTFTVTLPL
ncbi:MAG: ATP-binding protein [Caldilineaceae bacterium]